MIPIWVILLLTLIVIIIYLIWKTVIIPTITIATDKDTYDRTEIVAISGSLKDQTDAGIPDKQVTIAITPPSGDAPPLITATTLADGTYSASWDIPDDAPGGTYTITATALGVSASKTFRQIRLRVSILRV